MQCAACKKNDQDVGVTSLRCCDHVVCIPCIEITLQNTNRKTIRCPLNKDKERIICGGFLNMDELQWIVSPETFREYKRKLNDENRFDDDTVSETEGDEFEIMPMTFEELNLTEEEKVSGWGQVASSILELQLTNGYTFEEATAQMDLIPLWSTTRNGNRCIICLDDDVGQENGIILKGCFHIFCRECLAQHIIHCETAEVKCPYQEGANSCSSYLKPKEVEYLVPLNVYLKHYDDLALKEGATTSPTFSCRTPNCTGFCFIEDEKEAKANEMVFICPKCNARNCASCKLIHPGSCAEYKQYLRDQERRAREAEADERNRIVQRRNEQISEQMIQNNIGHRNFMRCPRCNIPCYKFIGCNHVVCGSCKHKFDWSGNEPNAFQ